MQTETPLAQRLKGETAAYLSKKIDIVHYTTGALRHKDTIKNPLSQKAKEGNHTKNESRYVNYPFARDKWASGVTDLCFSREVWYEDTANIRQNSLENKNPQLLNWGKS